MITSQQTIRLLHVEDDGMQRALVRHHLAAIDELQFDIRYAESEEDALELFEQGGADLVVLDYQLRRGNGLSCLRALRLSDPIVPVIAVSGVATPEIASELLQAGADDYISKEELTSSLLVASMRTSLIRASACRQRISRRRSSANGCLCNNGGRDGVSGGSFTRGPGDA
ncbi:response regulator [Tautonia sociabilis]|uniref:Response regulator n=1 Tax=Tautonia sociabilis TaxID=2080755 RepID=A0A432MCV0_9BACT|nr:response regulator [Tautonia sociabilis]RUL82325.1 response regulator [Tautonia sociabilis]